MANQLTKLTFLYANTSKPMTADATRKQFSKPGNRAEHIQFEGKTVKGRLSFHKVDNGVVRETTEAAKKYRETQF
jgi:hypothetical protein